MDGLDRIAGFAWPLPRAFSGAVAACRFEQGDVLYADETAYEDWDGAVPAGPILQVLDPPKSARAVSGDAAGDRFSVAWSSPVTVEIHAEGRGASERRTTTQGRLFSCLRDGDLGWFDEERALPDPPASARVLQRRLEEAVAAFRRHFAGRAKTDDRRLLLLAVDDASESSRVKAHAIEALLDEAFAIEAHAMTPAEAGLADAAGLHPALLVRGIAVSGADAEAIAARLAGLLYGGDDESAGRFSLARHAHLVPLSPDGDADRAPGDAAPEAPSASD